MENILIALVVIVFAAFGTAICLYKMKTKKETALAKENVRLKQEEVNLLRQEQEKDPEILQKRIDAEAQEKEANKKREARVNFKSQMSTLLNLQKMHGYDDKSQVLYTSQMKLQVTSALAEGVITEDERREYDQMIQAQKV